ncbi:hypothetical protein [Nitrosopumilus sp.]|uniref:hypothetical protein n=1 Tax=Nitrosopumilus sp. TaxID=2024843 RepID=UPI00349FDFE6
MIKLQPRTISGIITLLMLCASSLSITYSFAEISDGQNECIIPKNTENDRLEGILVEKMVNGNLEVRHYALPDEFSKKDIQEMMSFDKEISWAYVNYKTYHSGIVLFDGKTLKISNSLLEVSTNDSLNLVKIQDDLELSEKSDNFNVEIPRTVSSEDLSYKVVFSGKIGEPSENNTFLVSHINSVLIPEMAQNTLVSNMEKQAINSEKLIDSNQEIRNPISRI